MDAHSLEAEADIQQSPLATQRPAPMPRQPDGHAPKIGADITELQADLLQATLGLAELKGRVSQLPSPVQTVGIVLAVLAVAELSKYLLQWLVTAPTKIWQRR